MIRLLSTNDFESAVSVIRRSFKTVASAFGITKHNCPSHTSFITVKQLEIQSEVGYIMFGMFECREMIGYASISKESERTFKLHNLSVLPEYRHSGHGKDLLGYAKQIVLDKGGTTIKIDIIEENDILRHWYEANGFIHTETRKFSHLPFTVGFMEASIK